MSGQGDSQCPKVVISDSNDPVSFMGRSSSNLETAVTPQEVIRSKPENCTSQPEFRTRVCSEIIQSFQQLKLHNFLKLQQSSAKITFNPMGIGCQPAVRLVRSEAG
jgi:hypothetical protein